MVDNCIFLSQKVRIMPNASQRKIIDDLIARARFIHNFAIKRFNDVIEKTGEILNSDNLRNYYLAHRNDYEFLKGTFSTLENHVFKDIQKKIKINIFTLKKKKLNFKSIDNGGQSFYLSMKEFDIKEFPYKKHHYLQFDTLPSPIKIQNKMRFPTGIPLSVVIKKEYDKYYAGITFKLKREDYINSLTYKVEDTNKAIGIDLGAKQYITTSCGLNIECDRPLSKLLKREAFLNRSLSRKVHPLCKGDTTPKSKNYIKYCIVVYIAYLFHSSAICAVILLVCDFLKFNKKSVGWLTLGVAIFAVSYSTIIPYLVRSIGLSSAYDIYTIGQKPIQEIFIKVKIIIP